MEDLRAGPVTIPASELKIRFSRAGGPGGQNVNRRDTRVEISFNFAESSSLMPSQRKRALERLGKRVDARGRVRVVSSTARTQAANRELALARLAGLIADAVRPPPRARRPTSPSRHAVERRLKRKKERAKVKEGRRRPEVD